MSNRIYLDNAATSWPKRESAVQAAWDFITQCGATAGRGTYGSSQIAGRWISDARRHLARLIGASDARSIAFCSSGTHALNAALLGLLQPGDHVVTTEIEHNSVLRPLHRLGLTQHVSFDIAQCDQRGVADVVAAESLIRDNTRLIMVGHASNVTGAVQDLAGWSRLAKKSNTTFVVDASQTLGYLPIDVSQFDIDIMAAAGHKGLRALPGTGLLYVASQRQSDLRPIMTGGTGVNSESIDAELAWPQTIEVGNYNMPGIVSMAVAANELNRESEESPARWQTSWREPFQRLIQGLRTLQGLRLVGYDEHDGGMTDEATSEIDRVPLVSLTVDGWSVHDLANILDSSFGIEVRAGYHCAALVHRSLGTLQGEGTLRISPGHSTTEAEIDQLLSAMQQIINMQV
jgi:cysteine desulfurase / selenocysteine lyase